MRTGEQYSKLEIVNFAAGRPFLFVPCWVEMCRGWDIDGILPTDLFNLKFTNLGTLIYPHKA